MGERARIDDLADPARLATERQARLFGALADPTRLRIVMLIGGREMTGVEIAEALGISAALACHHIKQLVDCGLVRRRREGQAKLVSLDRDLLSGHLQQILAATADESPARVLPARVGAGRGS